MESEDHLLFILANSAGGTMNDRLLIGRGTSQEKGKVGKGATAPNKRKWGRGRANKRKIVRANACRNRGRKKGDREIEKEGGTREEEKQEKRQAAMYGIHKNYKQVKVLQFKQVFLPHHLFQISFSFNFFEVQSTCNNIHYTTVIVSFPCIAIHLCSCSTNTHTARLETSFKYDCLFLQYACQIHLCHSYFKEW